MSRKKLSNRILSLILIKIIENRILNDFCRQSANLINNLYKIYFFDNFNKHLA